MYLFSIKWRNTSKTVLPVFLILKFLITSFMHSARSSITSIPCHFSRSTILTSPTKPFSASTLSSRVWLLDYLTLASQGTFEILYKNLARRLSLAVLPLNSCSCSHTSACNISSAQTRIIAYASIPVQFSG